MVGLLLALSMVPGAQAADPQYTGTAAVPAEAPAKPESDLTAELGGSYTVGNTWVLNVTGGVKFDHRWGQNAFHADASVLINMAKADLNGNGTLDSYTDPNGDGTTVIDERANKPKFTSQRINSNLRYDRFFGKSDSLYVSAGEQRDQFAGLLWRFNEQIGYSRQLVQTDATKLAIEVGLAYTQENLATVTDATTGTSLNAKVLDAHYLAARVGATFTHAFNDKVSIGDDLQLFEPVVGSFSFPACTQNEAGTDCKTTLTNGADFRLYNTFYIQAKLSDMFSLKVSNYVQFDNQPVVGYRKVDTTTAIALVASIF